ncbi:transcription antiterminator [Bifidobacterium sp. ESL0775]|uniref:BglG family transcription antiterminator n=1 Tax=Bifidobacterium sp. ESL0775 TaxID=2983230 RepID=UPI0023F839DE|nr:transcription antiterminator [Bifidobacterium sp. ESL0775]WEV69220.1 transcription antiterminator [Bifidobacterium sp. ESL0775]
MTTESKKHLIEYLLNRRNFVSGTELSAMLGVSTKTVTRLVAQINERNNGDEPMIESQRGRGYRLNYRNYFRQESAATKQPDEHVGKLTPVERRDEVLKRLLMTSPQHYRIEELWGKFYISDSAIASDLKVLRTMLSRFNLSLEHSSDCVWVEGVEQDIRKAITDLIFDDDDVAASGRFMQPDQRVHQRDAAFVSHQLDLIEDLTHAEIPYPYSVNLFTHLYILVERFREVGSLIDDGETPEEAAELFEKHPKMADICKKIIANLNAYLDATLPDVESYYLYQYLTSSRIDDNVAISQEMPDQVREVTRYLIDEVAKEPGYQDIDDDDLYSSLVKHMKPLLNRLQNGIKVKNNLLEQIKLEYPRLFDVVKNATKRAVRHFGLNEIDDEEVGFIVVYFAQVIESKQTPINILLVCTTGLGTAQLLRAKIERRFSEFNIVTTVATKDLGDELAEHPEVDLVVSTVNLADDEMPVPTLVVSAMLTLEDQERLERQADQIRRKTVIR